MGVEAILKLLVLERMESGKLAKLAKSASLEKQMQVGNCDHI